MDKYDYLMYERAGDVVLDPLGTAMALLFVVVIGLAVANSRLSRPLKHLVYAALAFRVIGAVARYVVLFRVYGGSGDAREYYRGGLNFADALWRLDPAPLFDPANWWKGKWWGTQFVYFPSTLVQTFVGESMPGGFIIFSLFAFTGLCGFALAFHRTHPHVPVTQYARWIWFFPALWFWPSSIGKEAIVLLGMGLAAAGYAGRDGRINWVLLALGTFFVFAIRPEVAIVVITSLLVAQWLSLLSSRWTLRNALQAASLIVLGLFGLYYSLKVEGIDVGVEGVHSYMAGNTGREVGGDSNIDPADVGVLGVPLALVNILLRPFLWEAHNLMVLISAAEIMAFWGIAWLRRRNLVAALRNWRHDRLLRMAVPFIVAYSISLGMVIANMGIIARQRIFLFPFLFMLLEAIPRNAQNAGAASVMRGPAARLRPRPHPVPVQR